MGAISDSPALVAAQRDHWLQPGAMHYGIFNGRMRGTTMPRIAALSRALG